VFGSLCSTGNQCICRHYRCTLYITCIILSFASCMWFKRMFHCNFMVHFFDSMKSAKMCGCKFSVLRLQYTFGSAIFFKFGFLGQSSGRRMISYFRKKILKKAKYWRRNGGFTFTPEVKVYLLIDGPMARMQSTETIFAGITCMDVTNSLLSRSALLF